MKICIISGARPQFIKIAPLIKEMELQNINVYHIHSGQHYDTNMSDQIFSDLEMTPPDKNLNVGSGLHGVQTGKMIGLIEKELNEINADYVLVVGDTNSTLSGAIAASKLGIPVIHLEAGLRSFNWNMPEEINRILVDRISSLLITSTIEAINHLKEEGIDKSRVILTGDIMVDTLYQNLKKIDDNNEYGEYFLVTLHRQENVDYKENCEKILEIFEKSPRKIVFPIHPRTEKMFKNFKLYQKLQSLIDRQKLILLPPAGYLDFIKLQKNSIGILTDSGGLQKEAFILEKPCITARTTTEWIETLELGANRLLALKVDKIIESFNDIVNKKFMLSNKHPYGDGNTSKQIVDKIIQLHSENKIKFSDNINRKN